MSAICTQSVSFKGRVRRRIQPVDATTFAEHRSGLEEAEYLADSVFVRLASTPSYVGNQCLAGICIAIEATYLIAKSMH
jgi:hypothetical protein